MAVDLMGHKTSILLWVPVSHVSGGEAGDDSKQRLEFWHLTASGNKGRGEAASLTERQESTAAAGEFTVFKFLQLHAKQTQLQTSILTSNQVRYRVLKQEEISTSGFFLVKINF